MSRSRVSPRREAPHRGTSCDGTVQDYRRHSYRGEEPCIESREAWRKSCRFYRYTGVYSNREEDDATQQPPFMYRKPERIQRDRKGRTTKQGRARATGEFQRD